MLQPTRRRLIPWLTCLLWGLAGLTGGAFAATISGDVSIAGQESADETVISLEVREGTFRPPATHAKVSLMQNEFVPRILPILVGTTVDFSNADDVLHEVSSLDTWAASDLRFALTRGETYSYTFNKFGIIPLQCRRHLGASGYVVAMDTPYFALTDAQGRYTITNVPVGVYVLRGWHEGMSSVPQPVTLSEEEPVIVNVEMKPQSQ